MTFGIHWKCGKRGLPTQGAAKASGAGWGEGRLKGQRRGGRRAGVLQRPQLALRLELRCQRCEAEAEWPDAVDGNRAITSHG